MNDQVSINPSFRNHLKMDTVVDSWNRKSGSTRSTVCDSCLSGLETVHYSRFERKWWATS
jgi:hypothetical protein